MVDSVTAIVLSICIALAALAAFICVATLAVASPWWPQKKRIRYSRSNAKATISPVNLLCRTIETFALTSPHSAPRNRDFSRRSSVLAESQSLPLRFQPERLYGATSPHYSSFRSSFSSFSGAPVCEQSGAGVTTIGGYLAPPTLRPRSGSTSIINDLAKGGYESISPIPAFMSTINAQAEAQVYASNPPRFIPTKVDSDTAIRRKSLITARRTTLGSLSPKPIVNELGASMTELVSILGTQVSRSTQNSPSRKRTASSVAITPIATPPLSRLSPVNYFTTAEAPGGTINYRIFIDATGKRSLTVRVHLYRATNLPAVRPWKNSNYMVKAELIGFKSHFVQTSGVVTASCGSPRFSEGNPSVLDFVMDCGMPFNKSEENILLKLSIIEFSGRKPGEKSLLVASKEYQFNHHTLKGKSTLSADINWERCKACIDVYQLKADVLASLAQRETDGYLRFEIHEIRNMSFRNLPDNMEDMHTASMRTNLTPTKLRLRACLVSNGKATCVRKGFNIRLPTEFVESISKGVGSLPLILKDHVFNTSELLLTFRPPFQSSFDKSELFNKVGVRLVQWKILAYFVLILEDNSTHAGGGKRVRAIGCCCLGSNSQNTIEGSSTIKDGTDPLLSNVASGSSRSQVSQWLHIG
ncbi:unnamed protein product [Rodentolepis nana]|uniref:C2 domain-containing protein n=1 Tax=Rodentolepis nana TaxID=102285 RepID=A0A0R3T793_RODNA|nr:unnamed protein product [Rodentolepis nana]